MEEKKTEEIKNQNFFQKVISYFKYDSKLDKKINYSLLYNAYLLVKYFQKFLELIAIIFFYFYMGKLKLGTYLTLHYTNAVASSLNGFVPRVSTSKMLFYEIVKKDLN